MKVLKKSAIIVILVIVTLAFSTVTLVNNSEANGITVHIRAEVSPDNVNWYNFSGSESPGGQTLNLKSGDTFWARVVVRNTGELPINASGTGSINNVTYFNPVPEFDVELDADHNDNFYITNYFIGGAGAINNVASGYAGEIMSVKITLTSNVPADTIITGTANINNITYPDQAGEKEVGLFSIQKAKAQEMLDSTFRIVINQTLPRTGADL